MAVYKTFIDESDNELKVYINKENLCYISIDNRGDDFIGGCITLDSDDLTELISELIFIKKQIVV